MPRNYDPALGRFLNIDPLGENTPSQGAYNFALDNPFNYNDPSGMAAEDWVKNLETGVTTWDPSVVDQKTYNDKYGGNAKFSYEGKWTDHATDENGKLFNGFGGGRKVYLDKPTGDEVTSSKASISQGSNSKNEYNRSYQAFVKYGGDGSGSFKDNAMYVLDQVRVFSPLTQLADAISIWSGGTDSRGIPKYNIDGAYSALGAFPLVGLELKIANAATKGGGTFYRAMSNAEYAALEANQGLTYMPGKELFVSSEAGYSRAYLQKSGYDVLVQFNMKPGAMRYFNKVGVMHMTPAASRGWAARGSLLWKSEQGVMNLGIQDNTHIFNPWIKSFKKIP